MSLYGKGDFISEVVWLINEDGSRNDELEYIQKKLFSALKVPKDMLDPKPPGLARDTAKAIREDWTKGTSYGDVSTSPKHEDSQGRLRMGLVPKCECGGESVNTTHSSWCPKSA